MKKPEKINSVLDELQKKIKSSMNDSETTKKSITTDTSISDFISKVNFRNPELISKEMRYLIHKNPSFSFQFICDIFEYTALSSNGETFTYPYYQAIIDTVSEMYNHNIEEIESDYSLRVAEKRDVHLEKMTLFSNINSRLTKLEYKIDKVFHVLKLINVDKEMFYSRLSKLLDETNESRD